MEETLYLIKPYQNEQLPLHFHWSFAFLAKRLLYIEIFMEH
jgi:hypothetical protein